MRLGLFPGQGIPATAVRDALQPDDPLSIAASKVLGYDLVKKVRQVSTSKDSVLPTWLAQPAIFVAGSIAHRDAVAAGERFDMLAGHSMGEYTALTAAGSLTFEQGLRLVEVRGLAMQRAAHLSPGGMVALLSIDAATADEISSVSGASIANHNSPDQVVLSGTDAEIAHASTLARATGGRAVLLGVNAPFHTDAMLPATEPLTHALVYSRVRNPGLPVISNVTARPYRSPGEIRKLLVAQLTAPVMFRQSLAWAWEQGARSAHDMGPGRVVGGLAHKTFRHLSHPTQEEVAVGV